MATVREMKRMQVAGLVAEWARECVVITGDWEETVTAHEARSSLGTWLAITEQGPLPGTSTMARDEIRAQVLAMGAAWDTHKKVLAGVRLV